MSQRGWKAWLQGKEVKTVQKQPGQQEGRTHTRDALERCSIVSYEHAMNMLWTCYEHASRRLRLDIKLKLCKEEHGVLLGTKCRTKHE